MTRIIAGSAKGQRLAAPAGADTRPTTDRVREAVFSLILDWAGTVSEPPETALRGFSFLDLYAGSGAVALEAASRGAAPVVAVEQNPKTAALIKANAQRTGLSVQVLAQSVNTAALTGSFDVVYADPPYALAGGSVTTAIAALADAGHLAADALVIVERSTRSEALDIPKGFHPLPIRRYGETVLVFWTREEPQ
ncbi:MAG: 16S rRNA (guanine(966)-N(2))-methyltransferase RsmD [Propionibacteriaceae bacterium]|jgi:16S rRNA (guanine966-N2)-methyltransferase|nr:16S rRNA (guanine(966)-N(2))-methyltransferase RsmD [Propionibacteriaceae bacterium]